MIAVYKRELRSYLTSMIGYLFIFFILLLTGIYFSAYQLGAAYPRFEYTLSALTFVFLISVPILTMRVLAEERKQKTNQLLLTAPVSVEKIVLGKYFALVTIFAIPMLIMCFYPLLMTKFGTVSLGAGFLGSPRIFPFGLCKPCYRCVYFIPYRKSGHCGSADLCYSVCFLYDERNFLFLLRRSTFHMHYIRTSDSGSSNHNLHHDQKFPDFCSCLCGRRNCTCDRLCREFQLFLRRNPESTGHF